MAEQKVFLCGKGHCPSVEVLSNEVRIGEGDNLVVLKKEEWNALVEKIGSGELQVL